ncbi:MAG: hypothetical protein JXQ75_04465 [Phycisphaerae bacterium]|nr:hypothetical protein [Phycisphaerae bacterium]
MNDRVDQAMQEVWDWKRKSEEATRGMAPSAVIDFYRKRADEVQRQLGLDIPAQPAADAAQTRERA